jgi:hypothetical protein
MLGYLGIEQIEARRLYVLEALLEPLRSSLIDVQANRLRACSLCDGIDHRRKVSSATVWALGKAGFYPLPEVERYTGRIDDLVERIRCLPETIFNDLMRCSFCGHSRSSAVFREAICEMVESLRAGLGRGLFAAKGPHFCLSDSQRAHLSLQRQKSGITEDW